MNDDEKHCRLINVQNPAPKPKSQKRKQGEPVESSKNESDEWDKYAEPAACRKQNVTRHFQHHSEGKFSLEDMKRKSKDGSQINQQLAISHSTSCVPILNTNKQMVQTIWLCCNYALKHGVNPIDNKTVNLDPRSIKKQIENLCQTYRREIIHMIIDLLDEEDKHLKNMKESKETPKEDRMPKNAAHWSTVGSCKNATSKFWRNRFEHKTTRYRDHGIKILFSAISNFSSRGQKRKR